LNPKKSNSGSQRKTTTSVDGGSLGDRRKKARAKEQKFRDWSKGVLGAELDKIVAVILIWKIREMKTRGL